MNPEACVAFQNEAAHSSLARGEFDRALYLFKRAYIAEPDVANHLLNVSIALDKQGRFVNALRAFQITFVEFGPGHWSLEGRLQLMWNGDKNVHAIIILANSMFGETLCNVYWGQILRRMNIKARMVCHASLERLFSRNNTFDAVVGVSAKELTRPDSEWRSMKDWTPIVPTLYSLSSYSGDARLSLPFFDCPQDEVFEFRNRIIGFNCSDFIIGINWCCSSAESTRSIPLAAFQSLSKLQGVKLISLQKGEGSSQLQQCQFLDSFVPGQNEFNRSSDFYETSLAVKCCDLVVTCDTAVAHLCGGMAASTYLLLNSSHDGLRGGDDKFPLYPTLKLRRAHNGWIELLEALSSEISVLMSNT